MPCSAPNAQANQGQTTTWFRIPFAKLLSGVRREQDLLEDIVKQFHGSDGREARRALSKAMGFQKAERTELGTRIQRLEKAVKATVPRGESFGLTATQAANPLLLKKINSFFLGDPESITELHRDHPEVAKAASDLVAFKDRLAKEVAAKNVFSKGVSMRVAATGQVHLHRSYEAFENPLFLSGQRNTQDYQTALHDYVEYRSRQAISNGQTPNRADYATEFKQDYNEYENAMRGRASRLAIRQTGKFNLFGTDPTVIKHRREVFEELESMRKLFGEIQDPFYNMIKTVEALVAPTAQHEFFTNITKTLADSGLVEKNPAKAASEGMVEWKGSSFGTRALEGLYLDPTVNRLLTQLTTDVSHPLMQHPAGRAYLVWNMLLKRSNTVWSVATQVRNLESQPFFWLGAGHLTAMALVADQIDFGQLSTDLRIGFGRLGGRPVKEEDLARIKDLLTKGVLGDTARAGLLEDLANDIVRDHEIPLQHIPETFLARYLAISKNMLKKADEVAENAYRASDEIGKLLGNQVELGIVKMGYSDLSPQQAQEEAAVRTRRLYPTYMEIPKFIRDLRRWFFVGPFASFSIEMLRNQGWNIVYAAKDVLHGAQTNNQRLVAVGFNRIVGQILANAGFYLLLRAFSELLYKGSKAVFDRLEPFMLPWHKQSVLLPAEIDEKNHSFSFYNMSYTNPYAITGDFISAFVRTLRRMKEEPDNDSIFWDSFKPMVGSFLSPFISPDLGASHFGRIWMNKTRGGARLANPEDDPISTVLKSVFEAVLWEPVPASVRRFVTASKGGTSSVGFKRTIPLWLRAEVTGMKLDTLDLRVAIKPQIREFKEQIVNTRGIVNSVINRGGNGEEILAAYERTLGVMYKHHRAMYDKLEIMRAAGFTETELQQKLREVDAPLPPSILHGLLHNRFVAPKISTEKQKLLRFKGQELDRKGIRDAWNRWNGKPFHQ